MVTVSSPLDPIVNCVILVLSFPWTYLEKKKNHRMSREVHMKHNIASCPLFEGIEKHIWMVCFCKMKCLPTNLFTVLHKKSITSLTFGWHKINSKTFKYHFSEMSLCLYYSQEVPSKTPSRKEHFISLAWKHYVQVNF